MSNKVQFFISNSHDPYLNLSIEKWLIDSVENQERMVLFYTNSRAVVMGLFQNPWLECNLSFLSEHNINLVRRISGGGTVYHDLGNLNCTLISSNHLFSKKKNFLVFDKSLRGIGVQPLINQRNDILIGDKKISGSAFLYKGQASMQHSTLLFNSDLSYLKSCLLPSVDRKQVESRATLSQTSQVTNICQQTSGADAFSFIHIFINNYCDVFQVSSQLNFLDQTELFTRKEIIENYKLYKSSYWIKEKGPSYTLKKEALEKSL